jgi:hypothetical protein
MNTFQISRVRIEHVSVSDTNALNLLFFQFIIDVDILVSMSYLVFMYVHMYFIVCV